jgi:hypothetical protein
MQNTESRQIGPSHPFMSTSVTCAEGRRPTPVYDLLNFKTARARSKANHNCADKNVRRPVITEKATRFTPQVQDSFAFSAPNHVTHGVSYQCSNQGNSPGDHLKRDFQYRRRVCRCSIANFLVYFV